VSKIVVINKVLTKLLQNKTVQFFLPHMVDMTIDSKMNSKQ